MQPHGWIFQLNRSPGGVPKQPVQEGSVDWLGLEGDRQRDTRHHGGAERALCLYSLERILALQEEGHPILPGATGENVTIRGLDWSLIVPGVELSLGPAVRVAVTGFATPCHNIATAFAGEAFTRISEKLHPGWARAYVRVLSIGRVRVGDPVRLDP